MKKRMSERSLKPSRQSVSSSKLIPLQSTAADSLKVPKKKAPKKTRNFGDNITNQQKQPVFQTMDLEQSSPCQIQSPNKTSQIEPYLFEIGQHIRKLDDAFNEAVSMKLSTRCSESTEITLDMRKILIKWILQVADKFKVNLETVHICVQIIDYTLVFSHQKITKANFQLLGIAALFVASKYNEIYTNEARKFIYVCDGLYSLEMLFEMQSYILLLTNFNLQFPTVQNFMGPVENDDTLSKDFKNTVVQISRVSVMDFSLFNKYTKMTLTGVIVYLAGKIHGNERFNTKMVTQEMQIESTTFRACLSQLIGVYRHYVKGGEQKLQRKNS